MVAEWVVQNWASQRYLSLIQQVFGVDLQLTDGANSQHCLHAGWTANRRNVFSFLAGGNRVP